MRDFRWIYTLPANFPSRCSLFIGNDSNPNDLFSYRFCLFSDGFQDQFGGDNDRKYSTSRFKDLLIWPSHLPMPLQREKLNEELHSWKGANPQTDDILVVGVEM